ncbi:MAG TPA: hypothetical protein VJT70_04790 [Sphingomicrobium sp.]|nr:hypothetical protein [Sphingomicrobium sp.]
MATRERRSNPMVNSSNLNFYLARVEQARAEAEAATLDHVRERCRRSEAAWTALADRALRSERLRVEEAKRKADQAAVE